MGKSLTDTEEKIETAKVIGFYGFKNNNERFYGFVKKKERFYKKRTTVEKKEKVEVWDGTEGVAKRKQIKRKNNAEKDRDESERER